MDGVRFNHLIFTTWDHGISEKAASSIQQKDISGQIKTALKAKEKRDQKRNMTTEDKIKLYAIR